MISTKLLEELQVVDWDTPKRAVLKVSSVTMSGLRQVIMEPSIISQITGKIFAMI